MDSDFWTMRLAAAKRQFNMQNNQHQFDRFNMEDFEAEEEVRPDYPCPYCCEEFDISSLCSHLDNDHPYDPKGAVCPICSIKIPIDMLSHITMQHAHLFKIPLWDLANWYLISSTYKYSQRRGRLRRVPFPNSQALSLLGRDLREAHLQVLLGGTGFRSNTSTSSSAAPPTDNSLSSLILNFPASESDDISKSLMSSLKESSAKSAASQHIWKSSLHSSLSREDQEQRMRQAAGRAVFVQDLFVSTLLAD